MANKTFFKSLIAGIFTVCLLCPALAQADISKRKDVRKFITAMHKTHGFNKNELRKVFTRVNINPKIIEAISRPAEAKPWHEYRPIFLTNNRIDGGVEFWKQHEEALDRAYNEFGVAPEIIVAIIGVETQYGKHGGRYLVLESLATLAFNYPKRSKFFKNELEQFLLLAREEKMNPLGIKGSYAGAMGKPQFIPTSFRRFAVDFDGDGKRDLWENSVDVIGSVANYFARHNWRKDQPVASKASVNGSGYKELVEKGIRPHTELAEFFKQGIEIADEFPPDEKAALIELQLQDGLEHWVGLDNFYVITRYNHSELYAMAVYQLGKAIKEQRQVTITVTERATTQRLP